MKSLIDTNAFREFLAMEIKKRELTAREFSRLIGVAHTTVSRTLDRSKPAKTPSLEFLAKLAIATNTDIRSLAALLVPTATRADQLRTMFAELASQLPAEDQQVLLRIIKAWGIDVPDKKQSDEGDEP